MALSNLSVYAETIYLPHPQENTVQTEVLAETPKTEDSLIRIDSEEQPSELIQKEKPQPDVIKLHTEENIFNRSFKKTFETGVIKDVELIGQQAFKFTGIRASNGNAHSLYNNETGAYGFQGHFRDGTFFKFVAEPFKAKSNERLSEYYIRKYLGKHHDITLGQQRTPVGIEGSVSSFGLATGRRSQFACKYSDIKAIGAKLSGNYDKIEYNLGVFDTGRLGKNRFEGPPEFAGLVSLKPIKNTKKYGNLKIGGSYNVGKRDYSYNVYSAHLVYDRKKFHTISEYSVANGYNGRVNSGANSYGYYSTLMYDINPKIQGFCRMDGLNSDINSKKQLSTEYTAGMHYYIRDKNMRFTLSYIFTNNATKKPDNSKLYTGIELLL